MSFIVDFYKELDTVNLIIFWGVIIVVLLLLIFAIIITRKNKKLEKIIAKNGIRIDDFDDEELAIKRENKSTTIEKVPAANTTEVNMKEPELVIIKETPKQEVYHEEKVVAPEVPIKEETFVAEEHVMEYQKEVPRQPERIIIERTNNEPYQRNVLREVYPSQTSPVGITKSQNNAEKEMTKATELHEALNDSHQDETLLNQKKYSQTFNNTTKKGDYLEELSKKLADANSQNDVNRTEYELRQEEDAIISYEELMQKKDSIKTVDEEEAVISIEELRAKKEKLYNITKDEETDEFINELKQFRSDL